MSMMSDMKDMVRHHNYQMSDILNMSPFDYNLLKMMIAKDIQEEMDNSNNNNNGV